MIGAGKLADGSKALSAVARRFVEDEDGATAVEYGLIVGLIFLAIVGAVNNYANSTSGMYSEISSALEQ